MSISVHRWLRCWLRVSALRPPRCSCALHLLGDLLLKFRLLAATLVRPSTIDHSNFSTKIDTSLTLSISRNLFPLMPFHCDALEHFDTSPVIRGSATVTHALWKTLAHEKAREQRVLGEKRVNATNALEPHLYGPRNLNSLCLSCSPLAGQSFVAGNSAPDSRSGLRVNSTKFDQKIFLNRRHSTKTPELFAQTWLQPSNRLHRATMLTM